MKHPANRELFEYWNERRGTRLAPDRADIDPAAIRKVLGDTFVLEANGIENHLFRLAGTRLCALFGRELKTESFIKLWQRSGQTAIRELVAVVTEEKVGIVASATGATSDDTLAPVQLELLLLPLAYQSRAEARVLSLVRWGLVPGPVLEPQLRGGDGVVDAADQLIEIGKVLVDVGRRRIDHGRQFEVVGGVHHLGGAFVVRENGGVDDGLFGRGA